MKFCKMANNVQKAKRDPIVFFVFDKKSTWSNPENVIMLSQSQQQLQTYLLAVKMKNC